MKDFRHSSGPLDDDYFYGRDDEIAMLHNNINIRQHTALIGQRQFGKTALIHKAIERHSDKPLKAHIDLTRKATLHEAAKVMIDSFMVDNFGIKRFLIMASMDLSSMLKSMLGGFAIVKKVKLLEFELELKEISVLASDTSGAKSIDLFVSALEFIDAVAQRLEKKVVIFIDEFQRIKQFPEVKSNDVLWPMRSAIQNSTSSTLIIAGSKPTVVKEIISSPDSAFLHSFVITDITGVKEVDFCNHFTEVCATYGVSDIPNITHFIYSVCSGMPSYLSLFGRKLFDAVKRKRKLETDMYFKALEDMFTDITGTLRLFEEKISEIPHALIVYKAIFAGENAKSEAMTYSGTSDANIQTNTINKMIDNGFILRAERGVYYVVDTALGYYMAEITTAQQFKTLFEDQLMAAHLSVTR